MAGIPATVAAVVATPIAASAVSASNPTPPQGGGIWIFGDSIVSGTWLPNPLRDSWVSRLNERIGGASCTTLTNLGVGGKTVISYPNHHLTGLVETGPQLVNAATTKPNLVIVSLGINDCMLTADTAAVCQGLSSLRTNLLAAGAGQVKFTTILPYGHGKAQPDGWLPVLNGRRNAINNWLRRTFSSQHLLIERDGILEAPSSTYMDARYCIDGLHPNQWGALVLADSMDLAALGL